MASNTTYGDFIRRIPRGIKGIGMPLTMALFAVLLVALLVSMGSIWVGLGVGVVGCGIVFILARRDKEHRNIVDRAAEAAAARRRTRHGLGLYRSGMLGLFDGGSHPLPGVLSDTTLLEAVDGGRDPFCLVRHAHSGEYTLMLACQPQGAALVDDDVEDAYVAGWATFLEALARRPGVTQLMAVVDTSPDSGAAVSRRLSSRLDPDAPDLAARAMSQVMGMLSRGGARNDVTVAVNFRYQDAKGRPLDEATAARQIAQEIPNLRKLLAAAGGGSARCLGLDDVSYIARTCYDPASQDLFERFGDETRPSVSWGEAGPSMGDPDPVHDVYVHDSGISRTWEMCDPPSGNVTADTLAALLAPIDQCERKRVAIVYKLDPPDVSRFEAEQNRRRSSAALSQEKHVSVSTEDTVYRADRQAQEINGGAVICWFGLLVTATVSRGPGELERMEEASRAVESAAGASVIALRPCRGCQDSAFSASLPFGLNVDMYRPPTLLGRLSD